MPSPHLIWFLSAGEVSGDVYAAALLQALHSQTPALTVYGLGGPLAQAAGLKLLADLREHSAVGLSENLKGLPFFWQHLRRVKAWLRQIRPTAVILVDFQGFNLAIATAAQQLNLRVYYLMAPQDWLWSPPWLRQPRPAMRSLRAVLSVFPTEAQFYQAQGIPVQAIGHPLLDLLPLDSLPTQAQARQNLGLPCTGPLACLMPGSRLLEVQRLSPILAALQQQLPATWHYVLPLADSFLQAKTTEIKGQVLPISQRYLAMLAADIVVGASGTMVLEAALLGRPVVALYKVSRLTAVVAQQWLCNPWITLPNLLLQESLVPEFVQQIPLDRLAQTVEAEHKQLQKWQQTAQRLKSLLGPSGALQQASRYLLEDSSC